MIGTGMILQNESMNSRMLSLKPRTVLLSEITSGSFLFLYACFLCFSSLIYGDCDFSQWSTQSPLDVSSAASTSNWGNRIALRAVDGSGLTGLAHSVDPSAMWLENAPVAGAAITIDLGGVAEIEGLRIWNYNEAGLTTRGIQTLEVCISRDGSTWSTVLTDQVLTQASGISTYSTPDDICLDVTSRYIKLVCLSNYGDSGYVGLSEVQIFGDLLPNVINANSNNPGFDRFARYVIDNSGVSSSSSHGSDAQTMWLENPPAEDASLTITLDGIYDITGADIWNYNEAANLGFGIQRAKIATSVDGLNWTDSVPDVSLTQAAGSADYNTPDHVGFTATCRYIRITCLESYHGEYNGQEYVGLSEIQLHGTKTEIAEFSRLHTDIFASSLNTSWGFGRIPARAFDDSGMDDMDCDSDASNMWLEGKTTGSSMVVDLNQQCTLQKLLIWNYNETKYFTRSIKWLDIEASLDGGEWTDIKTVFLLCAPGSDGYDYPDVVLFEPWVTCRYLRLTSLENYGDTEYCGLSEVRVYEVPLACDPSPEDCVLNDEVVNTTNETLSWETSAWASSCDVYFGSDADAVTNASHTSESYLGNTTGNTWDLDVLELGHQYYWRIDSIVDSKTCKGHVWTFVVNTDPRMASAPSPRDYSDGWGAAVTLNWTAGQGVLSHDVYFGTDRAAVEAATTGSAEFKGNQTAIAYTVSDLVTNTNYYWRVDEVTESGKVTGPVWTFAVTDYTLEHGMQKPDHLYVINYTRVIDNTRVDLNDAESVLIQTLSGIVAQTRPQIFINKGATDFWLNDLSRNYGITYTENDNLLWYIINFKSYTTGKYILYDLEDPNSVNVAASLSGVLRAVAADVTIVSQLAKYGYTKLLDVRGRNDQWLFENYGDSFNHQAIVAKHRNLDFMDWGVAIKAMMLTGESKALCDTIYDNIIPCSPRYGSWEVYADAAGEGEYGNTSLMTRHGMYSANFDHIFNLPVYAGMVNHAPEVKFKQKNSGKVYPKEAGVHYVSILLSDNDNTTFTCSPWYLKLWYDSYDRGDFALGWGLTGAMFKNCPSIAEYYYRHQTSKDSFTAPLSGMGFMLTLESPCLDLYCQTLSRYMEQADIHVAHILEYGAVNTKTFLDDVAGKYNAIESVRGMIVDGVDGKLSEGLWYKGKPVMPLTEFLVNSTPVSSIVQAINAKTTNPENMSDYSIIYVGILDHTMKNVADIVAGLNSNVRVVTPDELMEQIYNNAVLKNAGFENPTVSSQTTGTYSYPQKFYDWQVIDGTVNGGLNHTTSPEGSQHMWASLNSADSTQTFTMTQPVEKVQAGYSYSLSVDIRQSSGSGGRVQLNMLVGNKVVASSLNDSLDTSWDMLQTPEYTAQSGDAGEVVSIEIIAENTTGTCTLYLDGVSCDKSAPGDITGDLVVDMDDLEVLCANWLAQPATRQQGDLTDDAKVNIEDLVILAKWWLNESD